MLTSVAVQRFAISRLRMSLLAGLPVLVCAGSPAAAQTATPDMLRADQTGATGSNSGFQPTQPSQLAQLTSPNSLQSTPPQDPPADSRIGNIPTFATPTFGLQQPDVYGTPAASGASSMGFDSLNSKKKTQAKVYPGAPHPVQPAPGSGSKAATPATSPSSADVQQAEPARVTPLTSSADRAPVSASVAGKADGQPTRRRLKTEDDPFGPVGYQSGGLLSKAAIELSGGFSDNPARTSPAQGSAFYVVAPELNVTSNWSRHSLIADLRGSFTGYGSTFPPPNSAPTVIDRPDFTGKVDGRIDVTKDTHIDSEARLRLSTDNPGSPNIQAGLSRYPIYTTLGGTLGVSQNFNRFDLSINGSADRTSYTESHLTDGTVSANDDRDFNQYATTARATYELLPFMKPYAEVTADTREHDLITDRDGYERNSVGGAGRLGTTFELTRLVTGDVSVGYTKRSYEDPRLQDLSGMLTAASLIWTVTPLTTATLSATSSIDETTLPGVSGVVSHDYGIQLDHAFRRWLIGTLRFGYGTSDYQGTRSDVRYSSSFDLVYKLTRTVQIKGEVRRDWQTSTDVGSNTSATTFMLGMRLQN